MGQVYSPPGQYDKYTSPYHIVPAKNRAIRVFPTSYLFLVNAHTPIFIAAIIPTIKDDPCTT